MAAKKKNENGGRLPLTPEQKAEMMRRREARLAVERGERPPQPLTAEQKKRLERQKKQELKARQKAQKQAKKKAKRAAKAQAARQKAQQGGGAPEPRGPGPRQRPTPPGKELPAARMSHSAARRARRKKRIIATVLILLFIAVGLTLSFTVLFPIDSYRVDGKSTYTEQQLIEASGLAVGDNIFRFRMSQKAEEMQQKLPYLETIKVRRRLPGTVVFLVEPAEEALYLPTSEAEGILLSSSMRVLDLTAAPKESLIKVTGYTASGPVAGKRVTSGEPEKDTLLKAMFTQVKASGMPITAMDLSDEYELTVTYAGRILIRLGTSSQLDYKLSVVAKAIEQGTADGTFTDSSGGTIDASSAGTAYYRP